MPKKRHPLDDEFDVDGSVYSDEFEETVEIPEGEDERDLHLVIDFALKQYKINCDDMHLMEPKSRLKVMELNRDMLNIVKDARYKLERLQLEEKKLKNRKGPPSKSSSEGESEGEEPEEAVSRNELQERLRRVK